MTSMIRIKLILSLVLVVPLPQIALAEGLDFSDKNQQVRIGAAYGIGYTSQHVYRKLGMSKTMSFLFAGLTIGALGLAHDQFLAKKVNAGNTLSYGIGFTAAAITFNLLDGDEAPKGYHELKNEQKQEQKIEFNPQIKNEVHVPEQRNSQSVIVNIDGKEVQSDKSGSAAPSKPKGESKKYFYPSPGYEKDGQTP